MIHIEKSTFDTTVIDKLYSESGSVVYEVGKKIEKHYPDSNELTQTVLTEWFFNNNEVSEEKISKFLLSKDNRIWIESYAKTACKTVWGDEKYWDIFLRHQYYAKEAAMIPDQDGRLLEIKKHLTQEHVTKQMFEASEGVKENKKVIYRLLKPSDLEDADQKGALCSTYKIMMSLRLSKNSEIDGFVEKCEKIFNYHTFSKKYRDEILNAIGVAVCPYCNRQYISSWGKGKNKRNTGDIEHFYNKDRFPFLALSLYNFIPSCQICNSRFKGTIDFYAFPHLNPYLKGFGESVRFKTDKIQAVIDYNATPKIDIYIDPKLRKDQEEYKEICNSIQTFHIGELYQNHGDYAKEIIKKAKMFSSSKIEEYYKAYKGMFSSTEELYQTIFGNYLNTEEQGKRPLAKLAQDIIYEITGENTVGNNFTKADKK